MYVKKMELDWKDKQRIQNTGIGDCHKNITVSFIPETRLKSSENSIT